MDKESHVFALLKGGESYAEEIRLTKNIPQVINSNIKKLIKSINASLPKEEVYRLQILILKNIA